MLLRLYENEENYDAPLSPNSMKRIALSDKLRKNRKKMSPDARKRLSRADKQRQYRQRKQDKHEKFLKDFESLKAENAKLEKENKKLQAQIVRLTLNQGQQQLEIQKQIEQQVLAQLPKQLSSLQQKHPHLLQTPIENREILENTNNTDTDSYQDHGQGQDLVKDKDLVQDQDHDKKSPWENDKRCSSPTSHLPIPKVISHPSPQTPILPNAEPEHPPSQLPSHRSSVSQEAKQEINSKNLSDQESIARAAEAEKRRKFECLQQKHNLQQQEIYYKLQHSTQQQYQPPIQQQQDLSSGRSTPSLGPVQRQSITSQSPPYSQTQSIRSNKNDELGREINVYTNPYPYQQQPPNYSDQYIATPISQYSHRQQPYNTFSRQQRRPPPLPNKSSPQNSPYTMKTPNFDYAQRQEALKEKNSYFYRSSIAGSSHYNLKNDDPNFSNGSPYHQSSQNLQEQRRSISSTTKARFEPECGDSDEDSGNVKNNNDKLSSIKNESNTTSGTYVYLTNDPATNPRFFNSETQP
eukprot:Awhi_evm1s3351